MRSQKLIPITLTVLLSIAACTLGCRKEMPVVRDPESGYASSFSDVFDRFWNTLNSNYQFWDSDPTDWDGVYAHYQPLFAKLDIHNEDDQRKSVQYFNEMLTNNVDGHLFISFNATAIANESVDPRYEQDISLRNPNVLIGESQRTPEYFSFTYYGLDAANYLDAGSTSGIYSDKVLGELQVLGGTINQHILYLGFNGEVFSSALTDPAPNAFKTAFNSFSNALKNDTQLKGVIIDMRGNGGGYGTDANLLASIMIEKPLLIGQVRYKNGTGRLDYTPWNNTYINPVEGAKTIRVPIIILTDILTFSAGEVVTAALHALPGAITVGTATGGGITGSRLLANLNGKGFTTIKTDLGDFMTIGMSTSAFKMPNGEQPIWGITPDYLVPFDPKAINAGHDPQLEKALTLIGK